MQSHFTPQYGTKPNIYHVGLYIMTKLFIAGNVAFKDSNECAEGVKVTLTDEESGESKKMKTDVFGVFEFDGLD